MRFFPIPFSMSAEEKIFGGHLSLRQLAYITMSVILFVSVLLGLPFIPLILRFFVAVPLTALGLSMAFLKIYELNFDRVATMAIRYYLRNKTIYPRS